MLRYGAEKQAYNAVNLQKKKENRHGKADCRGRTVREYYGAVI